MRFLNLCFTLLLSFFSLAGKAQQGFSIIEKAGFKIAAFGGITQIRDTIIVQEVGINSTSGLQELIVLQFDTLGNLLKQKSFTDPMGGHTSLNYTNTIIPLAGDKGIAMTGSYFSRRAGFFYLLDAALNLKQYKEYPDSNTYYHNFRIIQEVENGFIIGGYRQRPQILGTFSFSMRTDTLGNILWQREYKNTEHGLYFSNISIENNNEYLLMGSIDSYPWTPLPLAGTSTIIMAIDSTGKEKWRWESEWSLEELNIRHLYKTAEKKWMYLSANGLYRPQIPEISIQPMLVVRDSNFNLLLRDTFGKADHVFNHFTGGLILKNGDYLGYGMRPTFFNVAPALLPYNSFAGFMVRFDPQGNRRWIRLDTAYWESTYGSWNWLYDAVELSSGSIVACGYAQTPYPTPQDWGWLIKISPDGCLDTLFCMPATISLSPVGEPSDWAIYPNPADSWFRLHAPHDQQPILLELYSTDGRLLKSFTPSPDHYYPVHDLDSGMYLLKITDRYGTQTLRLLLAR